MACISSISLCWLVAIDWASATAGGYCPEHRRERCGGKVTFGRLDSLVRAGGLKPIDVQRIVDSANHYKTAQLLAAKAVWVQRSRVDLPRTRSRQRPSTVRTRRTACLRKCPI